jgi:hypothetical protein
MMIAIFAAMAENSFAQPDKKWESVFGGSNADRAYSVVETDDSGFVFAGSTMSNNGDVSGLHSNGQGDGDVWIAKISKTGALVWQQVYGGSADDVAHCIIRTHDGGFIVAGTTSSTDGDATGGGYHGGSGDAWIIKLNADGSIHWQKCYGGSLSDGANSIVQAADGNYVFAGFTSSSNGDITKNQGGNDYWVAKIDTSGKLLWSSTFGGSDNDIANSITQAYDGSFAVAGYSNSADGDITNPMNADDFWIIKVTTSGTLGWHYNYGGSDEDEANSIVATADSGFAVAGYTYSLDVNVKGFIGGSDFWILKLNRNGVYVWQSTLGGQYDDQARGIVQTADGGYFVVGKTNSDDSDVKGLHNIANSSLYSDIWATKLSPTGKLQWAKTYGGSLDDEAWAVIQTLDTGYVIAGETKSINGDVIPATHGDYDVWMLSLMTDTTGRGSGHTGAVAIEGGFSGNSLSLYPNPTNGSTKVTYELAKLSDVHVALFNSLGEQVKTLAAGKQSEGSHSLRFDLGSLPQGEYFIRLQAGDQSKVEGLLLTR